MTTKRAIRAICLDCGDTLVDEGTEEKNERGVSLRASLIPGAAELMAALKAAGYPLALVADGPCDTFSNNLGPYDLYDLFDVYAISETLGCEKPDPHIFQHALENLQIAPDEYAQVLMVGNNLERDIAGANALGITTVWLDWAPRRSKIPANALEVPNYTIKNPIELLDVIEALEQGSAHEGSTAAA